MKELLAETAAVRARTGLHAIRGISLQTDRSAFLLIERWDSQRISMRIRAGAAFRDFYTTELLPLVERTASERCVASTEPLQSPTHARGTSMFKKSFSIEGKTALVTAARANRRNDRRGFVANGAKVYISSRKAPPAKHREAPERNARRHVHRVPATFAAQWVQAVARELAA
jgi:hypothetical protein